MSGQDWGVLCLMSLLWGGSFYFYKLMAGAIPPISIALGRTAIAATILHAVLALRGERLRAGRRTWAQLLWLSLLSNALPFTLFAWAEHSISSGLASVLNATTPLFSVLVVHYLRIERFSARRVAGVLLGLAGVLVVVGPDALAGATTGLAGEAACILASILYAFGGVYARRFSAMTPLALTTGQSTASAILLLPASLAVDRPGTLPMPGAPAWLALFGIATLSTVLAYLLYFRLLSRAGPTNVSLVTLLVPVSALLLGAVALGERIRPEAVLGMGLIALGLAAIDGRMLTLASNRWRALS